MRVSISLFFAFLCSAVMAQQSPNGKLSVKAEGQQLTIFHLHQKVLDIVTADDVSALSECQPIHIREDYRMLSGKRLHCRNEANEYRCGGLVIRLYNDGIAIREQDERNDGKPLPPPSPKGEGALAYRIPEGTRRWAQQWAESYEGFFPLDTTYKVTPVPSFSGIFKSPEGWNNRWGYPLLVESLSPCPLQRERGALCTDHSSAVYALITEANIQKGHSASCLYNDGELFRVVSDTQQPTLPLERVGGDASPWRVIIVGTLADIVESTLVTDVSEPCRLDDASWIQPGVVSWIYWAYNHGSNDYNIIKKYVDMAATLHLPYVLIDAEWDEMKDGKTIEDAVAYAKLLGVKPLIWYNSSVGWVDGAPGPKYRLNKSEDREREFAWCERIGVAGVKIDFFSGDNQMNMDYCIDLLECAARHHLLVNFHGATIPRGWQRTYPNLLSTEGVYGAEWYNNVPTFTDKAACHNATLPFTRNVIGPMDYTPCAFSDSQHPHITTHAHELALTVLFESGLQHLADKPESYMAQPQEIQQFLSTLPSVWDETRLISGYPGESAVVARRSGNTWYIAGINGTDEPKDIELGIKCAAILDGMGENVTLFADNPSVLPTSAPGAISGQEAWTITTLRQIPETVTCKPRGGFVTLIIKD